MADTYEKDLGQKSSLTTSDFIRVVGSDNVSYKQMVSAVMTAMGLDAIKTPATSLSNIDTATATGFYSYGSGASGTKPLEGSGGDLIVISHNANYSVQVAIPYSPTNGTGIYKRVIVSGTPSDWQLQPTRAEVDSLNSKWQMQTAQIASLQVANTAASQGRAFEINVRLQETDEAGYSQYILAFQRDGYIRIYGRNSDGFTLIRTI